MNQFMKGHKFIDAEKLNDYLKNILPGDGRFDRNFIAYKIAENEDKFVKALITEEEE